MMCRRVTDKLKPQVTLPSSHGTTPTLNPTYHPLVHARAFVVREILTRIVAEKNQLQGTRVGAR